MANLLVKWKGYQKHFTAQGQGYPDCPEYAAIILDHEKFILHCRIMMTRALLICEVGVWHPECLANVLAQQDLVGLVGEKGQPVILPELAEIDVRGKFLKNTSQFIVNPYSLNCTLV